MKLEIIDQHEFFGRCTRVSFLLVTKHLSEDQSTGFINEYIENAGFAFLMKCLENVRLD